MDPTGATGRTNDEPEMEMASGDGTNPMKDDADKGQPESDDVLRLSGEVSCLQEAEESEGKAGEA